VSKKQKEAIALNVLLATNTLSNYAGTEVVVLESARAFRLLGHRVQIYANYFGNPILPDLQALDVTLLSEPSAATDFDLIWSQHQTIGNFLTPQVLKEPERLRPYIVFPHFSPYEPFEAPLLPFENLVGDRVLANSSETQDALIEYGVDPGRLQIFPNPAPRAFFRENSGPPPQFHRLTLISNHAPVEVLKALELLHSRHGICVRHIGNGGRPEPVRPELIFASDALLTIGKSVQYGLVARVPVYCYDHFGGPGWLAERNYDRAREFNFSGRCCRRKLDAETIVSELLYGFESAADFSRSLKTDALEIFCLEHHLQRLATAATDARRRGNGRAFSELSEHRADLLRIQRHSSLLRRESGTAQHYVRKYRQVANLLNGLGDLWASGSSEAYPCDLSSKLQKFLAEPADATELYLELRHFCEEDAILGSLARGGRREDASSASVRVDAFVANWPSEPILSLQQLGPGNVTPLGETTIEYAAGELVLVGLHSHPGMLLSDPSLAKRDRAIILIALLAEFSGTESNSMLRIYFKPDTASSYTEQVCRRKRIDSGFNVICVATDAFRSGHNLRIDPGTAPGKYTITRLVIL
jgi:hypothetical protein